MSSGGCHGTCAMEKRAQFFVFFCLVAMASLQAMGWNESLIMCPILPAFNGRHKTCGPPPPVWPHESAATARRSTERLHTVADGAGQICPHGFPLQWMNRFHASAQEGIKSGCWEYSKKKKTCSIAFPIYSHKKKNILQPLVFPSSHSSGQLRSNCCWWLHIHYSWGLCSNSAAASRLKSVFSHFLIPALSHCVKPSEFGSRVVERWI